LSFFLFFSVAVLDSLFVTHGIVCRYKYDTPASNRSSILAIEKKHSELSRKISDRVQSEKSQRKSEYAEIGNKIHELEKHREEKDQEIAELNERLDALETSTGEKAELHTEQEHLLSRQPQPEEERNDENGNRCRSHDETSTPELPETEDDPCTMRVKDKIRHFEEVNTSGQETPISGQRLSASSCGRKLSSPEMGKRKPSQTAINI